MGVIGKGVAVLRSKGALEFTKRSLRFSTGFVNDRISDLQWAIRKRRGHVMLSTGSASARFVARDRFSTDNTLRRFREERDIFRDVLDELKQDDVFYDIGANTGLFTCFVGNRHPDTEVVAVEPYRPNVEELERNLDLNRCTATIVEKAFSNETDLRTLSVPDDDSPGHGTASIDASASDGDAVELVRGDDLVSQGILPQPNVVKIDVEGAEPLVLDGMQETLRNEDCRLVYCEVHLPVTENRPSIYNHDVTPEEIRERFEEWGFDITRIVERRSEYNLKAVRSSS